MAKIIPRELIKHLEWIPGQATSVRIQLGTSPMDNPWKYAKTRYDVSNSPYFKHDNFEKDTVMTEQNAPVNFENAQHVEINIFNSPSIDNTISDVSPIPEVSNNSKLPPDTKTKFQSIVETLGKIVSIISGLAVLVFVLLLWLGKTTIGEIQIGHMLTVFSFTLFSSLISIGGVRIFTLSASLRKANEKIENYMLENGGCPFYYVVDDSAKLRYQVESAYKINDEKWCRGCFLVDHNGHTDCKISPHYQRLTSRSS